MFTAILSGSLAVSINRFLAIDLNRADYSAANRTFNTALALSLIVAAVMLLLAGFATPLLPTLFRLPKGLETDTQLLFVGVVTTTVTAMFSGNFNACTRITHRFDLYNLVRVVTLLVRVGVVFCLFSLRQARLQDVAMGLVVAALIGLVGDVIVWRRLTPQIHINRRDIDPSHFRGLLGLSSWSAVNFGGAILISEISLILVNTMLGADMTGRYGSLIMFPTLIETMTDTVANVLCPAIMAAYAVGDTNGVQRLASRAVKLLGLGLALPVGLLCGLGGPLLSLWLGHEFAQLDRLLLLLVAPHAVNLAIRPLLYIVTAYNRVKIQALLTVASGLLNVALALHLTGWAGWGAVGVATATAVAWTIKNVGLLSGYAAVLIGLHWWAFLFPLLGGAFCTLLVALSGRLILLLWWPESWLSLGLLASLIAAAYVLCAYFIGLNASERKSLVNLIKSARAVKSHPSPDSNPTSLVQSREHRIQEDSGR
jgi:membrane protein EpsK